MNYHIELEIDVRGVEVVSSRLPSCILSILSLAVLELGDYVCAQWRVSERG